MWREARDWNVDFFKKTGYTVYCTLNDYQSGYSKYKMLKRFWSNMRCKALPGLSWKWNQSKYAIHKKAQKDIQRFEKTRSSHLCYHKGLELSQRARFGEQCSDPDRNTARQVLNSHPVMLAILQNPYGSALLARYQNRKGLHCQFWKNGRQCTACQVVKTWQAVTLTQKTVNKFRMDWQQKSVLVQ